MRRGSGGYPGSARRSRWITIGSAGALGVLAATLTGSTAVAQAPSPPASAPSVADSAKAEDFLVVDCLLPGQIRRLGSKMTFLGPRRPLKTTTRDCEIRGGEYASYDRANYATALKVWLEAAKQGDAKAQTYVGEIYEKGLGTAPDHAAAAEWYRRAAEQGFAAAAINLGGLYERGLGVQKDQREALNWYRRASGLTGLTYEIAPDPTDSRLAKLEGEIEEYRRDLAARQGELGATQRELEALRGTLAQRDGETQAARAEVAEMRRELQALEARERTATAAQDGLRRTIQDREAKLQAKERETAGLQARLARLQAEPVAAKTAPEGAVRDMQTKLARTESEARAQRAGLEPLKWERDPAGPEIELLNVQLVEPAVAVLVSTATGSAATPGAHTLLVVGRVASPAAIRSFTINGIEQLVDASPTDTRFRAELTIRDARDDRVRLIALDGSKRRTSVELGVPSRMQLAAAGTARGERPGAVAPPPVAASYHALVIGVGDYSRMSRLETPVRDAEAVSRTLRQDYGFNVRLVTNASRTQIMGELNDLRERLSAKDNLLIYFAGRGELNQKSQKAYWLPSDARPGEPGSWISDTQLSDVLNVMPARQLLVVADSPYAATLTRSANGRLEPALKDEDLARAIQGLSAKRARMVMTSGGLQPLTETAGAQPSVFAGNFLEVLRANRGVMLGRDVYRELQVRLHAAARRLGFSQVPGYAPIKYAGHDGGDFVFVRKRS